MENTISATTIPVSSGALSSFYVASWTPALEAEAIRLRDTVARYYSQNIKLLSGIPSPYNRSYSLDHANVEYAHAAGLTGTGQLIAIVDNGFLTTHDEFSGKTLTMTTGAGTIDVEDHGTTVAAIAAGVANAGQSIGVAPGANLHLGSFLNGNAGLEAATQQARLAGAIVQNNSWGIDALAATSADYNLAFGSASGQGYINALRSFANNAVIVFAASNTSNRTQSDLMAGLPAVVPGLEPSWITAINAIPNFSGGSSGPIVSATRISSACLQAAAWCMAADGTVYGAVSTGNSDYAVGTGTSFAAPQISGAVALLAQAFPSLTAQDLRARLLASANNSFYTHTGYVEFGTVKHGYDSNLGHGFLDLKAALSPIGGSFMPRANGTKIALNTPLVLSGGMAGNAISARLANYELTYVDGLGGGFDAPADILAAHAVPRFNPDAAIADLLATDLSGAETDPFNVQSSFSSSVDGQELDIELDQASLTFLLPSEDAATASYGVAVSREFDLSNSRFEVGFMAMREGDGVVGIKSLMSGERMSSTHGAATFEWAVPVQKGREFSLSGSVGVATPTGSTAATSMSSVQYNSLKLSYAAQDLFGTGDKFTVGVGLPQAVQSGTAKFVLPVARSGGATSFKSVDIPLAPEGRQLDLSVSYGMPISRNSEVVMSAIHSLNSGNIAGERASTATIGWKFEF